MFIPSEPAYIAAMQGDPNLWNYAYEKRILLLNPTNLITSLKLIADLWKRERQNRNAQEIADRGRLMYDKFVGFVEKLELIGDHIDKAKRAYSDSLKQLSTGDGNLIKQATELKNLGIKNKKSLRKELEDKASGIELPE
jgi:DNA recombination protein RmuC